MIALLALAALAQDAPPPAPDIVIIGDRLKAWRGSFRSVKGVVRCKTTKSSGDAAVDAIGCDAMVECISPIAPQLDAIAKTSQSKADRNRALNAAIAAQVPCLNDAHRDGIARLAGERRGA